MKVKLLISIMVLSISIASAQAGFMIKLGSNKTWSKSDFSHLETQDYSVKSSSINRQIGMNLQIPLRIEKFYVSVGLRYNFRELGRKIPVDNDDGFSLMTDYSVDIPVDFIYYLNKYVGVMAGVSYSKFRSEFGSSEDPYSGDFWNLETGIRVQYWRCLFETKYTHGLNNLYSDGLDAELYYRQFLFQAGFILFRMD